MIFDLFGLIAEKWCGLFIHGLHSSSLTMQPSSTLILFYFIKAYVALEMKQSTHPYDFWASIVR